jgi:peptide/nickel transport system substrate-binding protein
VSSHEPVRGGVLREGYDYDFSRCDPGTGAHVDPAWCAIYETLTATGPDGVLGPMLAESWAPAEDYSSWRFRIRPAKRFHSGDACDAGAVAAALRLHSDPVESPINAFFWKNVKAIDADGDEVVVALHEPASAPPRLLRSWHSAVHDQATRERLGEGYGYGSADGTGPFRLVTQRLGEVMEVERVATYVGPGAGFQRNQGPAHLDAVRWLPILSESERASALEDGEVDCIQNASIFDFERLSANPNLEVIEFQQSALVYLGLDHQAGVHGFDDVRVRRAVSLAIDRRALVSEELAGHGWPAFSPIPSHSPWYDVEVEQQQDFDPRQAVELLDQAGRTAARDGVRISVEAVIVEDATVRRTARRICAMLSEVGIELRLREVSGFAAFYAELMQHPDAFISKWFWPEPVDAIIGFVSSWSQTAPNFQRANSATIDAACRRWERAIEPSEQQAAAKAIQQACAEDVPLVPLFFPAAVWAHHRRVHGWCPHVHDLYPLYGDVWLERD